MRVLIPTMSQDVHALVVQRALARQGHVAVLTYAEDLPQRATVSALYDGEADPVLLDGWGEGGPFDTVWVRRPWAAELPSDLHPDDRPFASREWRRCIDGLWNTVEPRAFHVSDHHALQRADCKLTGLRAAAQVGLRVPRTLVSNDPARIRAFVRENDRPTIYKPFSYGAWSLETKNAALLFCSELDPAALPDDDVLRLTPGLFQAKLEKRYELRVNVIGDLVLASRIDSQAVAQARLDWRAGNGLVDVYPVELPAALATRCLAVTRALGLVFGCLDLVVTTDDEAVFLEINPMGQFLWLEELNPAHRLLDAFCALLVAGRPDFGWRPDRATLRYGDFYDPARDAIIEPAAVA